MHILFVIANNSSVPYFNLFMEKAAESKDCNFSFLSMTKEVPLMIEEASEHGFNGYWVPYDLKRRKGQMIRSVFRIIKLLKKIRPDVVHTHLFDDSVPALLAARLTGVPVRVITKQDTGFHYNYAKKWMLFDKFNNCNATHVVPVSEEAKEFIIIKEKCNPKKIHTIHHGIDIIRFSNPDKKAVAEFRSKYNLESSFVIGNVARFIKWKNHEEIIDIAESVIKEIPNAKFLLIGQGEQLGIVKNKVEEKKLNDNFIFTGFIEKNLMQNYFAAMDVYLHTAYMEPFGFVIAEAMAAGLPVVSTPTGAARDAIIHKENGWLGNYNNIESLAEGINFFHSNKKEKPWTLSFNTAKEKFDFKFMYYNYIQLYKKAYNEKTA